MVKPLELHNRAFVVETDFAKVFKLSIAPQSCCPVAGASTGECCRESLNRQAITTVAVDIRHEWCPVTLNIKAIVLGTWADIAPMGTRKK